MLTMVRVGSDQVSESISWVKVNSKGLKISPESTILRAFLTSHMLTMVRVGSDEVLECISWVKVNSKGLKILPESTILRAFFNQS